MNISPFVNALDGCTCESTIKLKITDEKNFNNSLIEQPNCLELVLHGEQNQGHSTGEVCSKYFCILALVFIYESKMDQNLIFN